MPERKEGFVPFQTPTKEVVFRNGERNQDHRQAAVGSPSAPAEFIETLRHVPETEEPAYWPVVVMSELQYVTDPVELPDSPKVKQWEPYRESLLRVKKAYEILAYPHIKKKSSREFIEDELEMHRQLHGIDEVELDEGELRILGKLAATAEIPFNRQKSLYSFSEVPTSPDINFYGRQGMGTDEIRKTEEK